MLLYYITDRNAFAGSESQRRHALLQRIADAARAGVDCIQLREKDLSARDLESLSLDAMRAIRENSATTKLLINARADIAIACGADGVHLPARELAVSEIRALWKKCSDREPVIGVSAHSPADVHDAASCGANLAVLAPIFEKVQTRTHGIGLEVLHLSSSEPEAGNQSKPPSQPRFALFALGGVTLANAGACLQAGAAGVAGIRLFQEGDIFDTVRRLRELAR